MKSCLLYLVLIAICSSAVDVEIGFDQGVSDLPWGACMFSIRCQILIPREEIDTTFAIDEIRFNRTDYGSNDIYLENPNIYFALTDLDELTDQFDLNYDPNERYLVYSEAEFSQTVPPGGWVHVFVDDWMYMNERNLLVEITYTDALVGFQTPSWYTSSSRLLWSSDPEAASGYVLSSGPHLILSGYVLSLEQSTFGRIKTAFQ